MSQQDHACAIAFLAAVTLGFLYKGCPEAALLCLFTALFVALCAIFNEPRF